MAVELINDEFNKEYSSRKIGVEELLSAALPFPTLATIILPEENTDVITLTVKDAEAVQPPLSVPVTV